MAVPDGHSLTAIRCVVLLDTFCVFLIAVSFALLFEHILAHQVFVDVPNHMWKILA